ncbi:hypothetical protein EJ02DRAFT_418542 [Clathrospora elynae]|uniref:Uncharacterized protein n=1 Tax=Clathrospora elynae TaxID=706981 RepID=A0A6A5T318_9PLEO|nr:hypothetical protein EJ02DRAFT_418542 [Clathrospora elynae]
MAYSIPDMSAFLNPHLCANTKRGVGGACQNDAALACSGCHLVQYCSKECQIADRSYHKKTSFIGGAPLAPFGTRKFLWGNMPAIDMLNTNDHESEEELANQNIELLFAASGDLRNVVKTVVGLPESYGGECTAVLNDKELIIVARNAIMLLIALYFDPEVSVPMIIHLWYSASIPGAMVQALQSHILPLVEEVCGKVKDKSAGSVQAKTFTINGRKLRVVLKKEEWFEFAKYFTVPKTLTADEANVMRRRVTVAPERIDYRERAMLQWPGALRLVDMNFRQEGVFLPFGCSLEAFDTPNPYNKWPMKDSSTPRDGWHHSEYMKYAPAAKEDEHGAVFFYVRSLLLKFCSRIRNLNISIQLSSVNAQNLGRYVRNLKFDRIEISNICDHGYLGPHECLQIFSSLLKSRSANPKATLLVLFMNAAPETEHEHINKSPAKMRASMELDRKRLEGYMPIDKAIFATICNANDLGRHPDFVRRSGCNEMLKNWDQWFETFKYETGFVQVAASCGLKTKGENTIIEAWPYTVRPETTKKELDVLRASGTTGYERYLELVKAE